MPLRHRVLSQKSTFLIFYMHLIEKYVTKHKNDVIIELYFDRSLNLPVYIFGIQCNIYDIVEINKKKYRKNTEKEQLKRERESEKKRDHSFLGHPLLRGQLCFGFLLMRSCQQLHIIPRQADQQSPLHLQNTAIE